MNPGRQGLLVTALLFPGILLFLEIGRRIGVRRRALEGGEAGPGSGALKAAEYGLLGLSGWMPSITCSWIFARP